MEKKTYYVSVASGDMERDESAADFEFEIQASEDELSELEELFEHKEDADHGTAKRSILPFKEYHEDEDNDRYDENLKDIYQMLHKLGTPETRAHIESMHVI